MMGPRGLGITFGIYKVLVCKGLGAFVRLHT